MATFHTKTLHKHNNNYMKHISTKNIKIKLINYINLKYVVYISMHILQL